MQFGEGIFESFNCVSTSYSIAIHPQCSNISPSLITNFKTISNFPTSPLPQVDVSTIWTFNPSRCISTLAILARSEDIGVWQGHDSCDRQRLNDTVVLVCEQVIWVLGETIVHFLTRHESSTKAI